MAPPELMEVNMSNEKRMIGDYEVLNSIRIGEYEIVLGECTKPGVREKYLCGFLEENGVMMQLKECMVSDSFADVATIYGERIAEKAEETQARIERENALVGNDEPLTSEDCIPVNSSDNLTGKVVVIKPAVIRPEYRRASHQILLCAGGFGAQPNARGTSCFCKSLIDGSETRWRRQDIIGTLPYEKLPEWAKVRLEKVSAELESKNVERGDR